jgi:urease accessory protein
MPVDRGLTGTGAVDPVAPSGTGRLCVRAERLGARTVVTETFRTAPFHLGLPSERAGDGSVELIVQGVGPGYFPGDRLEVDITVGAGASLVVRGQGATKVYPSPCDIPATVEAALAVEPGGRLVYLPGEVIPYREAVLDQVTRIDVTAGGALALGEILTPGRVAMGEVNQFTRLHLDVEAVYDGRTCLIERARLDPARRPLTSVGHHGPHQVAGSLYLIGDGWMLPESPGIPATVAWAAASGDGYTLVRLLGPTVQAVSAAVRTLLALE